MTFILAQFYTQNEKVHIPSFTVCGIHFLISVKPFAVAGLEDQLIFVTGYGKKLWRYEKMNVISISGGYVNFHVLYMKTY